MVVETGRIDHTSHTNDVAGTIYDTLAFNNSIKEATEFYAENPDNTLYNSRSRS